MHIAICDDNVADRKQLERLLKRESEKRASISGVFYVDSFGHSDKLLNNPMQYDVFFIDMCKGNITGIDVLNSLKALVSTAPVVLCSSEINYREYDTCDRVLFLDKPIRTSELSGILDKAQELANAAEPVIELREEQKTYYVKEEDIMYAVKSGRNMIITLANSQQVIVATSPLNLYSQLETHKTFFAPSPKTILNGRHIDKILFHRIIMRDGAKFKAPGKIIDYASHIHQQFLY